MMAEDKIVPAVPKVSEVWKAIVGKTLLDTDGISYGISRQQAEILEECRENAEKVMDEPCNGIMAPVTPTDAVNIFQWALAGKLAELVKAGVRCHLFLRDEGYDEDKKNLFKHVLDAFLAKMGVRTPSYSASSSCGGCRQTREHRKLQDMLLRFDIDRSQRMLVEELHLAYLRAMDLKIPFLLLGYAERPLVEIVEQFLPPDRVVCPIYLPSLSIKQLILLRDTRNESIDEPGSNQFRQKLERELYVSDRPAELLAQLDCLIVDRTKPFNKNAVEEIAAHLEDEQQRILNALERTASELEPSLD